MAEEPNKTTESITLNKKDYESRMSTASLIGIGVGTATVGFSLLLDRKIEKATAYGIGIAGLFGIGLALLFRKIDNFN